IRKGDTILDIGANLGYYTLLFANWTGKTGKVYAVEPVKDFADTIKWATKNYKNIEVYNYALGENEQEVTLATPDHFGYLRTGLAHVIDNKDLNGQHEFTFKAQMKKGSVLFQHIPRLDFIKCDIEGYEEFVLPEINDLLLKFKPVIQVETWGDHKPKVEAYLLNIGYEIFDLEDNILKRVGEIKNHQPGDLIFIHTENCAVIDRLINDKRQD
ncbi:MAG: FkbM family methyltransferase, partial [Ferruginibacter sp.]